MRTLILVASWASILSTTACVNTPTPTADPEPKPEAAKPEEPSTPAPTRQVTRATRRTKGAPATSKIGGHTPQEILTMFGYKGVPTRRQASNYRRVFGFLDANGDGRHSKREYIDNGVHMTPQARRGIFNASDSDRDGFVSEAEYVENRAITDEAKEIFYAMDTNRDNRVSAKELTSKSKITDEKVAIAVFKALDSNGNQTLVIPEYLRVWGRWARSAKAPDNHRRE